MNQFSKQTKILFGITFISVVLAIFSFFTSNNKDSLDAGETSFAVEDSTKITSIILENKGEKVSLTLDDLNWKINNSMLADKSLVMNLLNFLSKTAIQKPIPNDEQALIRKRLTEIGTKISVYHNSDILSQFNLLFDSDMSIGLKDGFSNPYILNENLSQNTKNAIDVAQMEAWKNRVIFNSKIISIERISVSYTDSSYQNFVIKRGKSKFEIDNMKSVDSLKVLAYLQLFENIDIKRFCLKEEQYKKDSLLKSEPTFEISLSANIADKSNAIAIYYVNSQKPPVFGLVGEKKELCIIKPRVFEYLLQKRSFFAK